MIRKAKEADIEDILNVLSGYNFKVLNAIDGAPVDDDAEDIITVYNQISELDLEHAFVALQDGGIVGFCHYKHLEEGIAKTTLITVLPQYRELGLGKALQLARMKNAYERGYKKFREYLKNKYSSSKLKELNISLENIIPPDKWEDNPVLWTEWQYFKIELHGNYLKEIEDYLKSLRKDLVLLATPGNEVMLLNEPGRYFYTNLRYRF